MSGERPLPKGWRQSRLLDSLKGSPRNGYSPKEAPGWSGRLMLGLGCLTPSGFKPAQLKNAPIADPGIESALLRDGDLLLSRSNTRDLVALPGIFRDVGVPCSYPDLMMRLEANASTSNAFLELALRSHPVRGQLMRVAVGTSGSMVKVNAASVSALSVELPSEGEQNAILEISRRLDDAIAHTEAVIEKLQLIPSSLRDTLLDLSLSCTIGDILKEPPKNGYSPPESGLGGAAAVLGQSCFSRQGFALVHLKPIPLHVLNRPEAKAAILQDGDLLVSRANGNRDLVGLCGIFRGSARPLIYPDKMIRLSVDPSKATVEFLATVLKSTRVHDRFVRYANGSVGMSNITAKMIVGTRCPLPPLAEQHRIVAILDAHDARIRAEQAERDKLVALKRGLLDDLLTGRVRVPPRHASPAPLPPSE